MSLKKIRDAYEAGRLGKPAYIEQMFAQHKILFDYRRLIEGTAVESVTVDGEVVRMRFKWPPVELVIPENEMRAAPVEALNFGTYEAGEFAVVEKLVASLPATAPVFLDVGANVGFYSIGLKRLHPALRIHAFEPVPDTADLFERNCRLNQCSDITLHRFALSAEPGETTFYVHPQMSVAASQQNILGGPEPRKVSCRLVPLDDIAAGLPAPVDFIKCDVEGAEWFVFKGGARLIERDRPIIFSEMLRKWSAQFGYHPNDIIAFFRARGYACHALGEEGTRPLEAVTDDTPETNFLFLHTEKHEGFRLHS